MLLPASLVQLVLIVVSITSARKAQVSAKPIPTLNLWDAQEISSASCTYQKHPVNYIFGAAPLEFNVWMYGFGSQEDGPGRGLLDNMRSPKRGSMDVIDWHADWASSLPDGSPNNTTNSDATFKIWPTAWTVGGVEGAISDASGGRVQVTCTSH